MLGIAEHADNLFVKFDGIFNVATSFIHLSKRMYSYGCVIVRIKWLT